jgi:hypothetical protein
MLCVAQKNSDYFTKQDQQVGHYERVALTFVRQKPNFLIIFRQISAFTTQAYRSTYFKKR